MGQPLPCRPPPALRLLRGGKGLEGERHIAAMSRTLGIAVSSDGSLVRRTEEGGFVEVPVGAGYGGGVDRGGSLGEEAWVVSTWPAPAPAPRTESRASRYDIIFLEVVVLGGLLGVMKFIVRCNAGSDGSAGMTVADVATHADAE